MDMLNLCDELRKKLYLWSQEKFWPILEENKQLKEENEQLKEDVKAAVDFYDHSLIIEKNSIKEETLKLLLSEGFCIHQVDYRPTAENFAAYFYHELEKKGYWVKEAIVYETPNNCAVYSEE